MARLGRPMRQELPTTDGGMPPGSPRSSSRSSQRPSPCPRIVVRTPGVSAPRRPRVASASTTSRSLEERRLLTSVQWISNSSGNWDVASNWSTNKVPGPGDDVTINVNGATPTITIDSGNQSVQSLSASDPLSITGGALEVSANSTIGGTLSMTGGSLTVNGSGVTLDVTGATTIAGGSLYTSGGTLVLP